MKKLTESQIKQIKENLVAYLGTFDTEYSKIVELNIKSAHNQLSFKYPNTYNFDEHELLLTEKTAYQLNEKDETNSKIIVATTSQLITRENMLVNGGK